MTVIRRPIRSSFSSSPLERQVFRSVVWILIISSIATISMVLFFMPTPKNIFDSVEEGARSSSYGHHDVPVSPHKNVYHDRGSQTMDGRDGGVINHVRYQLHRKFHGSKDQFQRQQRQKHENSIMDDHDLNNMDDADKNAAGNIVTDDADINARDGGGSFSGSGSSGSSNKINSDNGHQNNLESKLFPFHKDMDESTKQGLFNYVQSIRNPFYETNPDILNDNMPYDIYNCPDHPPPNYPYEYPLLDIIHNWNPNDTTFESLNKRPAIYATICRFQYSKNGDIQKALNYRKAEVPFILRDDPTVLQVVKRWNTPNYLSLLLNRGDENKKYKNELSQSNHLMFFRTAGKANRIQDWVPPMSDEYLTYDEFVEKASQPIEEMGPDKPHWYFRVNAKAPRKKKKRHMNSMNKNHNSALDTDGDHFLFKELPFFQSIENFYIVEPEETRGINCRFGMNGNIAEAHFDGSRNFVMLFGGERRYVLSHPKHCPNLALYPHSHPSGRHSALDWSNPDLQSHPEFRLAKGNEVVLQAGDVLYLPTQWFHFIISLNLNWQCNARSGITDHYQDYIKDCGF